MPSRNSLNDARCKLTRKCPFLTGNGKSACRERSPSRKKGDRKCRRALRSRPAKNWEMFCFDTDTVGRLRSFSAKNKQTNLSCTLCWLHCHWLSFLELKRFLSARWRWLQLEPSQRHLLPDLQTSLVRAVFFLGQVRWRWAKSMPLKSWRGR